MLPEATFRKVVPVYQNRDAQRDQGKFSVIAKAGDQLSGLVVGDKDQCLKSGNPLFFIRGEDPSSLPCLSP